MQMVDMVSAKSKPFANRSYVLRCRNIAYSDVKDGIKKTDEIAIVENAWHACNVAAWDSQYKGGTIDTKYLTTYPTEHFAGCCGSDIFVICDTLAGRKIYVADSFGWTQVSCVAKAISRIIYYSPLIRWAEIRNKEDFFFLAHTAKSFVPKKKASKTL